MKSRALGPKQKEILQLLKKGWTIRFGMTSMSCGTQSKSFNFGRMLCPPKKKFGSKISDSTVDSLVSRGILEEIKRKPVDVSSIETILARQSEGDETHRLTELGTTYPI